jgi:hypothetical protein
MGVGSSLGEVSDGSWVFAGDSGLRSGWGMKLVAMSVSWAGMAIGEFVSDT